MSGEIIAIITVGVAPARLNLTSFRTLRSEIAQLRAGITALREHGAHGPPQEAITRRVAWEPAPQKPGPVNLLGSEAMLERWWMRAGGSMETSFQPYDTPQPAPTGRRRATTRTHAAIQGSHASRSGKVRLRRMWTARRGAVRASTSGGSRGA